MANTTMLTVIPKSIAECLSGQIRIKDYNNLPQLRREVLEVIKEFIADEVGYESIPIAGLCQHTNSAGKVMIKKDFTEYIPVNAKDSVLLILEIPEDQIVSVNYQELLDISEAFANADGDASEVEYLRELLWENLSLGGSSDSNVISFIPFLDYKKCKYFAVFNSQLEADKSFNIPGLDKIPMRELTSFTN